MRNKNTRYYRSGQTGRGFRTKLHHEHEVIEFDLAEDGKERCTQCGHAWNDYGPVHDPDCRFFVLEEPVEEYEEYKSAALPAERDEYILLDGVWVPAA